MHNALICHSDLSRSREPSAIITQNKLGSGHHEIFYFPIFGQLVGDNQWTTGQKKKNIFG